MVVLCNHHCSGDDIMNKIQFTKEMQDQVEIQAELNYATWNINDEEQIVFFLRNERVLGTTTYNQLVGVMS